jgi:hypothetical protein
MVLPPTAPTPTAHDRALTALVRHKRTRPDTRHSHHMCRLDQRTVGVKLSAVLSGPVDQVLLDMHSCCVKVVLRLYEMDGEDGVMKARFACRLDCHVKPVDTSKVHDQTASP